MSAPAMPSFLFAAIFFASHVVFARALPNPSHLYDAESDPIGVPRVNRRDSTGELTGHDHPQLH